MSTPGPDHIDLVALETVERLLRQTHADGPRDLRTIAGFASLDELVAALVPAGPPATASPSAASESRPPASPDHPQAPVPLPRRIPRS
jgi:hypothetical protein